MKKTQFTEHQIISMLKQIFGVLKSGNCIIEIIYKIVLEKLGFLHTCLPLEEFVLAGRCLFFTLFFNLVKCIFPIFV